MRPNLYTIRTTGGLVFYVEAASRHEAEQRVLHPVLAKAIFQAILAELASIESVELHRGPAHTAFRKLVFEDKLFK